MEELTDKDRAEMIRVLKRTRRVIRTGGQPLLHYAVLCAADTSRGLRCATYLSRWVKQMLLGSMSLGHWYMRFQPHQLPTVKRTVLIHVAWINWMIRELEAEVSSSE